METLNGNIEKIIFRSEDDGFSVLSLKIPGQDDLITITAHAELVYVGQFVECYGNWVENKKYGKQFRTEKFEILLPTTLDGMEKFLASGRVEGIGPSLARKLVEQFGLKTFEMLDEGSNKISQIAGIGEKRAASILASWAEQRTTREIIILLQSHGIGTAKAIRIFNRFGATAVTIIRENPYLLAQEISGIGFKTADSIAKTLGFLPSSHIRAKAFIFFALKELSEKGHCACNTETLISKGKKFFNIPNDILTKAIELEISDGSLIAEEIDGQNLIFLPGLYFAEMEISKKILRLSKGLPPWSRLLADDIISQIESVDNIEFSASQKIAINLALKEKILIITGGPGVGKTKTIQSILHTIQSKTDAKVLLCAPTGRAAKRLSESTGQEAKTVHRLLEFEGSGATFKKSASNNLEADLVVIDEVSMIDSVLMSKLLAALPRGCSLICVGDVDQLPSVGPGAVLKDLIQSDVLPVARLTDVFRQSEGSEIVANAHRINQGEEPFFSKDQTVNCDFQFIEVDFVEGIRRSIVEAVCDLIPSQYSFDSFHEIQVLSPTKKGTLGTMSLNTDLQNRLLPLERPHINRFGSKFGIGDKIIQKSNNYDKGVFNGDIGFVIDIMHEPTSLLINFDGIKILYRDFELEEIALAYALTIHKSQGSEYNAVVIPLCTEHSFMLERHLIYTAVTRAKKLVVLIGQREALSLAVKNVKSSTRITGLKYFLQENS